MKTVLDNRAIRIESWQSEAEDRCLANDVLDGLTRPFKEMPPKHFYDSRGSELFERNCGPPEYYPTRAERSILESQADAIVRATRAGELVELGSGSADKARILLDAMSQAETLRPYVPLDVSERVVEDAAWQRVEEYDGLRVHGVIGDFERHLDCVPM
jgi:L-histidine Nalpha-methyltransferase